MDGKGLGRLSVLAPATVILAVAFLLVGQDMFLNPFSTTSFSPTYLLLFATIRSFFLLSFLVALCSLAIRYFNRPNRLAHTVADNSYYIYLIHIFVVAMFQDILMIWPEGPEVVKMLVVFSISLLLSYVLSRWVFKKLTIRAWFGRMFRAQPAIFSN